MSSANVVGILFRAQCVEAFDAATVKYTVVRHTTTLVHYVKVQTLQLVWRPDTRRRNLRGNLGLSGHQMGCRDQTDLTNPTMHLPMSHNAPFRTEMCTFLIWMVHCVILNWCIVGFVNLVWSLDIFKTGYQDIIPNDCSASCHIRACVLPLLVGGMTRPVAQNFDDTLQWRHNERLKSPTLRLFTQPFVGFQYDRQRVYEPHIYGYFNVNFFKWWYRF